MTALNVFNNLYSLIITWLRWRLTLSGCVVIFQIIRVDKSVLVNRAALAEPTDVFVRSAAAARQTGNKMASPATTAMMSRAVHRGLSGSCPRMDSICEGSDEASSSSSEDETGSTFRSSSTQGRLLTAVRSSLPAQSTRENKRQLQVNNRTGFMLRSCVDVGTNTSSVEHHDQSTSTDSVCSVVVDGKMAECINKLRTVSQRLEQQQPSTPRNISPPESTPPTPPHPINDEHSPPRTASPTSSVHVTAPATVSVVNSTTSTDGVEQTCDQEDEVQQFISELKSRTLQETSPESKRLTHTVPGRRFVIDRKRAGNLSRLDHVPESPTASPRPRRSNPTDRPSDGATSRRPPSQRSYSPRALTHNSRSLEGPCITGTHDTGSPMQRRSATTKKLAGMSSPPAMRSSSRAVPPGRPARPQSAKAELTTPAGPSRSPGSSPRQVRPARTAAVSQRLAAVDDEQARSTSDSDSLLTHSGGSSDDQEPAGFTRPPTTPKLARKQRLDMTQLLLVKSASLPDQQPGGATGVKQVRASPTTARRTTNPRHS